MDCNTFGHVYKNGVCVMCGKKERKGEMMKMGRIIKGVLVILAALALWGMFEVQALPDVESVVRVAEAEIASLPYEVVIAFDAQTGAEIFRKNGEADGIWLTRDEALRAKNAIVTHNHPGGGLAFSLNDLQLGEYVNVRQLRVVTPDLRRCVVTRPANASAWRGAFLLNERNYAVLVKQFGSERAYQENVFQRWNWEYKCG